MVSTFHHFADLNWDTDRGAPSFVTDKPGDEMKRDPAPRLEIFKDVTSAISPAGWAYVPEIDTRRRCRIAARRCGFRLGQRVIRQAQPGTAHVLDADARSTTCRGSGEYSESAAAATRKCHAHRRRIQTPGHGV